MRIVYGEDFTKARKVCESINMSNQNIIPLFPHVICASSVEGDLSSLDVIKTYEYESTNNNGSMIYNDFTLLDKFPFVKNKLTKNVNEFVSQLYDRQVSFKMTTSWATKCQKGQGSDFHNHKNCMYSAVLYLDDVAEGGELRISSEGLTPSSFMMKRSESPNAFNSDLFYIKPERNLMVIFPSYLMHKIGLHTEDKPRYSIAMNFFPDCDIGENDSLLER